MGRSTGAYTSDWAEPWEAVGLELSLSSLVQDDSKGITACETLEFTASVSEEGPVCHLF